MSTRILAAAAITLCAALPALADGPTKDDAMAICKRVAAHVEAHGMEATATAVMDPANADFHQFEGQLYAFIGDFDGLNIAHGAKPSLAGRSTLNLRDPNGVMIKQEMIAVARDQGEGWVDYSWQNPKTGTVDPKTSYVIRLNDTTFCGAGIWK